MAASSSYPFTFRVDPQLESTPGSSSSSSSAGRNARGRPLSREDKQRLRQQRALDQQRGQSADSSTTREEKKRGWIGWGLEQDQDKDGQSIDSYPTAHRPGRKPVWSVSCTTNGPADRSLHLHRRARATNEEEARDRNRDRGFSNIRYVERSPTCDQSVHGRPSSRAFLLPLPTNSRTRRDSRRTVSHIAFSSLLWIALDEHA